MSDTRPPVTVDILAFPETTASVVYGIYDLFMSAGRDWGFLVDGHPGPGLVRPLVVSAQRASFVASNDVPITPQASLDQRAVADVICIPELAVPPGESFEGRFKEQIEWLQRCYAAGPRLRRRARAPCCWQRPVCSTATKRPRIGPIATSCSGAFRR